MPKKPIKRGTYNYIHSLTHTHTCTNTSQHIGIKVFCLVLATGFLYDWHIYRGSDDPLKGPLYMYRLIYDTLLAESIWDHANATIFCDAAFTSIKLFKDLHNKRGINAVGPINASKPAKGAGPNSWPMQKFKKTDTNYLPRGWDRVAFTKLQRGGWMQSVTWRDNKFVKLLSTVFISNAKSTVLRYSITFHTHSHTHPHTCMSR